MPLSFTSTPTPDGATAFMVDNGHDGRVAAVVRNSAIDAELKRLGQREIPEIVARYSDAAQPEEIRKACGPLIGIVGGARWPREASAIPCCDGRSHGDPEHGGAHVVRASRRSVSGRQPVRPYAFRAVLRHDGIGGAGGCRARYSGPQ